jgi:hypothetical protein
MKHKILLTTFLLKLLSYYFNNYENLLRSIPFFSNIYTDINRIDEA